MTKIKTLSIIAILFAAVTAPVFAQEGAGSGSRSEWQPAGSADNERPGLNSGISDPRNSGMRNVETSEPGDFAVTGGLSPADRRGDPTGEVDPGTSNSPAGNAGGE
jgi:hypothetical protein